MSLKTVVFRLSWETDHNQSAHRALNVVYHMVRMSSHTLKITETVIGNASSIISVIIVKLKKIEGS